MSQRVALGRTLADGGGRERLQKCGYINPPTLVAGTATTLLNCLGSSPEFLLPHMPPTQLVARVIRLPERPILNDCLVSSINRYEETLC